MINNNLGSGLEYIELNPELTLALEAVGTVEENNRKGYHRHIVITGKAGSGKSTFLDIICNSPLYKKENTILMGTTGVATNNIMDKLNFKHKATTCHRGLKIGGRFYQPGSTFCRDELAEVFKDVDRIVIDEASMLDSNFFTNIISTLMAYRGLQFLQTASDIARLPQIILLADNMQLSPVVKEDELKILLESYDSVFYFHSWFYNVLNFLEVSLSKCYRTKDLSYVAIINKMRDGTITQKELLDFNRAHVVKSEEDHWTKLPTEDFDYVTLAGKNSEIDKVNKMWMDAIPKPEIKVQSVKTGDVKPSDTPLPEVLVLKEGATVMLLANDPGGRYVNGTIGNLVSAPKDIEDPSNTFLYGNNKEMYAVVDINGTHTHVYSKEWEIFDVKGQVVGKISNLPLKVSFGVSIHKSQSLSLESLYMDPTSIFADGQAYVGVSRAINSEYFSLAKPLKMKDIKVNKEALAYTKRIEKQTEDILAGITTLPKITAKRNR